MTMKKMLIVLLVLALFSPAFASGKNRICGAGLGAGGNSSALSDVRLHFLARPFSSDVMNPFVRLETGLEFGKDTLCWSGLDCGLGFEIFRTMHNPFAFAQTNPGPWSPSVYCGMNTDFGSLKWNVGFSPVRVLDRDYVYEWFGIFWNFDGNGLENWGVRLFRFSAMF